MRLLSVFLTVVIMAVAVSAAAGDMNGFRGFTWGSEIKAMQESDPKLVEGHMGVMPGVSAYKRTDEDLNFGEIKAESITYNFYKGRFTSVNIDFRGFDSYETLLA